MRPYGVFFIVSVAKPTYSLRTYHISSGTYVSIAISGASVGDLKLSFNLFNYNYLFNKAIGIVTRY